VFCVFDLINRWYWWMSKRFEAWRIGLNEFFSSQAIL
jgi:hypothetical protein